MNPDNIKNSIDAIITGLTPLTQKMGIAIGNFWSWALLHNYAKAISGLVIAVFMFICIIIVYFTLIKKAKFIDKDYRNKDSIYASYDSTPYWGIGISLIVLFSILFFISFYNSTLRLLAPQWYTAEDVVCLVHNCN